MADELIKQQIAALKFRIQTGMQGTGIDPTNIFNAVDGLVAQGNIPGALKMAQAYELTMRAETADWEARTKHLQFTASGESLAVMERMVREEPDSTPAEIQKQVLVLQEQMGKTAVSQAQLEDSEDVKSAAANATIIRNTPEWQALSRRYKEAIAQGKVPQFTTEERKLLESGTVSIARRNALAELQQKQAKAEADNLAINKLLADHGVARIQADGTRVPPNGKTLQELRAEGKLQDKFDEIMNSDEARTLNLTAFFGNMSASAKAVSDQLLADVQGTLLAKMRELDKGGKLSIIQKQQLIQIEQGEATIDAQHASAEQARANALQTRITSAYLPAKETAALMGQAATMRGQMQKNALMQFLVGEGGIGGDVPDWLHGAGPDYKGVLKDVPTEAQIMQKLMANVDPKKIDPKDPASTTPSKVELKGLPGFDVG